MTPRAEQTTAEASLDLYAGLALRVVSATTAVVVLAGQDSDELGGAAGLPEYSRVTWGALLGHPFLEPVVRLGRPVVVADAHLDELLSADPVVRDLPVRGYAAWPLADHAGEVVGSLCVIDSQPHPWTDLELANLADVAAACAVELAHRRLALGMAAVVHELRRSNVQLTAFAGQISHDLRNPLSALSASLQMLDEARRDGEATDQLVDRLVTRALSSTARMLDLVGSVLGFAMVDGRLSPEDVDVQALVASVLEDLAVAGSGVVIDVGDLAPVRADPEQLRTVVQNLVANAIKHGGGATVSVTTDLTGRTWTLRVADRGPGIEPGDRMRVLEPLVRLDHDVPGSGLGLATSRRVAEVHGGTLEIGETPGGGTTVCLSLPRRATGAAQYER